MDRDRIAASAFTAGVPEDELGAVAAVGRVGSA
jgi:hypothetical protein